MSYLPWIACKACLRRGHLGNPTYGETELEEYWISLDGDVLHFKSPKDKESWRKRFKKNRFIFKDSVCPDCLDSGIEEELNDMLQHWIEYNTKHALYISLIDLSIDLIGKQTK